MTNAIQFLEAIGASPMTSRLSTAQFAASVELLGVVPAHRQALIAGDFPALGELLNARPSMICMVAVPDGDEAQEVPDQSDDEQPDQEPQAD